MRTSGASSPANIFYRTQRLTMKTLYYRATYIDSSGEQENEIFISDSMDHAAQYALSNAGNRTMSDLNEYSSLSDAWNF